MQMATRPRPLSTRPAQSLRSGPSTRRPVTQPAVELALAQSQSPGLSREVGALPAWGVQGGSAQSQAGGDAG